MCNLNQVDAIGMARNVIVTPGLQLVDRPVSKVGSVSKLHWTGAFLMVLVGTGY